MQRVRGEDDHDPALARHIPPPAATLRGICTTLIGLVKILEQRIGPSHVDEYGALIAALFLASAGPSYGVIRTIKSAGLSRSLERGADGLFLLGLVSLTLLALLFAYELV